MKKIKYCLAFLFCATVFFSCIDTEEYIVVNADHSGSYTMKMDMGKMLEMMAQFGGGKQGSGKPMPKVDTLIYFKDLNTDKLTPEEKELYRNGSLKVKVDSATNQFKMEISCPFKSIARLPEIRKNLFDICEKLGADKIVNDKGKSTQPDEEKPFVRDEDISKMLNPSAKDYNFTAEPGKISYKSSKPASSTAVGDSMMQMMQQLTMLTGEMTVKTIITLPNPVKKTGNSKAVLSADKKTVTFSYALTDLMEKPEEGEFEIEY